MSKSMCKVIGPDGATFEFLDTAGVCSLQLDGVQVLGAQGSAIASLVDGSGGTADGTVVTISGSGADSDLNNNFADLTTKLNVVIAALRTAGLIAT